MSTYPQAGDYDPSQPWTSLEHLFVWLPVKDSVPMVVQPDIRKEWAKLFWDLGVRWHKDLQTKKIQPPFRADAAAVNPSAMVVDVNAPDVPAPILPDPGEYSAAEVEVFKQRLREIGVLPPDSEPPADESFKPARESVADVLAHLATCSELEFERVITAESMGLARAEILKAGAP